MSKTLAATLTVAFAFAAPAMAQFPLQGFVYNWDRPALGDALSIFVRWSAPAESVLARIDRDDYPEWGVTPAGTTQIQGQIAWIEDVNDATVEQFSLVAFEASAAQTDFPDLAVPKLNIGPISMPPTGVPAGPVAYRFSFTLAQPVAFAGNRDVFVGLGLPAVVSTAPLDGLFVGSVNVDPANAPFPFDVPGPRGQVGGGIGQQSYICYVPTGQAARYLPSGPASLEQMAMDVRVSSGVAGGVALARTAQANFVTSNLLGTSDLLSGSHPDIARGDSVGFAMTANSAQVASGSLAIVLLGFGPSPFGSLPISTFAVLDPSSAGNMCLDFTTALTFFTVVNAGQANSLPNMVEGQFVYPIGPAEQAIVQNTPAPLDLWWQGLVLDAANPVLEVHATGCAVQHLK